MAVAARDWAMGGEKGQKSTGDDKRTFETHLTKLCLSEDKNMSNNIRIYLQLKADSELIVRPANVRSEYNIIQQFGYPRTLKAYYAASDR